MRTWNFGKCHKTAVFFRLCLVTVVALSLAMGGMSLNPRPVQAALDIDPPAIAIITEECVSFTNNELQATGFTCEDPPQNLFFWLVDTGAGIPDWVDLDPDTGVLSGCPPVPSAGVHTFGVMCTEFCGCAPSCTAADCWPNGAANWPCWGFSPVADVTITVLPLAPLDCVTAINATYYPVAWEGFPFTMHLSATGGVGTLTWTADGLPDGLTVSDNVAGIISGIPDPGTCGIYTVTATVSDNGTCEDPSCPCVPISRPFILIVDCWANYLPFFYYATACDFDVEIGPGLTQGYTNVIIDGTHEATLVGGQSETFVSVPCESHLVMVDQTVQVPSSNTRFSVIGSNTKLVTDVDDYAYFDYAQEVNIQTASEPSGATHPPGAGFYTVGSTFSSIVPATIETDIQNGVKLVFDEWGLPDGTTRPIRDLAFIVNQGGTVVARYDTYYQLTLKSDYPAINERSWELANSTATWNLSLHAVPMLGFWGFLGGVQSPLNASGSQLITGSTTIEIMWAPNYTMPIIAILITLLVIAGVVYLIYRLRSKPAAQPVTRKRVTKKTPPGTKKRAAKKRAVK